MTAWRAGDGPRTSRGALVRYALAWVTTGGVVAALALAVVGQLGRDPVRGRSDPIASVTGDGCVLAQPRGLQERVSRPPVSGPPAPPAADGIHRTALPRRNLIGSLRRGAVVVQYQPSLDQPAVEALRAAFTAERPRRVLVPDATGMPFAVASTAWGRVLGCSKVDADVVRALRAFAARYAGGGPDS
jgi:hypothetical protein